MSAADISTIRTFEELEYCKWCRALRRFIIEKIIPILPKEERYPLGDQLLRAARSATANIAEGYGRFHYLDNAKFCSNSRGSCWEILDHLIAGRDEGFISTELLERGRDLVAQAIEVLNGYMKYLKSANTTNQ
jgi:S23 ribosomal protein.